MKIGFGKYRGTDVRDLPDDYLRWLLTITLRSPLREAVEEEAFNRFVDPPYQTEQPVHTTVRISPADVELARLIVHHGYRSAAKLCHPDTGGDPQTMLRLNALASSLRDQLAVLAEAR